MNTLLKDKITPEDIAADKAFAKYAQEKLKEIEDNKNKVENYIGEKISKKVKDQFESNIQYISDNFGNIKLDKELVRTYVNNYITHVKDEKLSQKVKSQFNIDSMPLIATVSTSYNSSAAVNYAYEYCGTYLGTNYTVGYNTNFYPAIQGHDCANFVSQCLVAGGFNQTSSWWCKWIDLLPWGGCFDWSDEWANAQAFRNYWNDDYRVIYSNTDTKGEYVNNCWDLPIYRGDVVQFVNSKNVAWHTMIITSYGSQDYLYSAHSLNRKDSSLYGAITGTGFPELSKVLFLDMLSK